MRTPGPRHRRPVRPGPPRLALAAELAGSASHRRAGPPAPPEVRTTGAPAASAVPRDAVPAAVRG